MSQTAQTIWVCDGTCGTTVVTTSGVMPAGWVRVNCAFDVMPVAGDLVSYSETLAFADLACLDAYLNEWRNSDIAASGVNPAPPS